MCFLSLSKLELSALSREGRFRGVWTIDGFQCVIKPRCVMSVSIALDFICFGTELRVLHGP